jgi:hypothetical protein
VQLGHRQQVQGQVVRHSRLLQPPFPLLVGNVGVGDLLNELSGAKQAAMPRERVIELFHRGLLFLNSLMDGINETRLR